MRRINQIIDKAPDYSPAIERDERGRIIGKDAPLNAFLCAIILGAIQHLGVDDGGQNDKYKFRITKKDEIEFLQSEECEELCSVTDGVNYNVIRDFVRGGCNLPNKRKVFQVRE